VSARSTILALTAALLTLSTATVPAAPAAGGVSPTTRPRASLPSIERQVMCVTCKIPLNVAESPQADRERAFIQGLIDEGRSEAQIKQALVGQYGASVLGLPGTHGFDLTVYLVPVLVVLVALATILLLLPRWRRSAAAHDDALPPPGELEPGDAARLQSDMARFD
jgi:cytochrome c-type biogenesis protein CcmH